MLEEERLRAFRNELRSARKWGFGLGLLRGDWSGHLRRSPPVEADLEVGLECWG